MLKCCIEFFSCQNNISIKILFLKAYSDTLKNNKINFWYLSSKSLPIPFFFSFSTLSSNLGSTIDASDSFYRVCGEIGNIAASLSFPENLNTFSAFLCIHMLRTINNCNILLLIRNPYKFVYYIHNVLYNIS